jgi:hypothetical protein
MNKSVKNYVAFAPVNKPENDGPRFQRHITPCATEDLKIGGFTHADAGQMNLYLNYAREHWMHTHENPPVGLILCSKKDAAVAHYSLGNLSNQVLAREYQLVLPREGELAQRLSEARRLLLESRVLAERFQRMSEPTKEELLARIAELERQQTKKQNAAALSFKVSEKGAVSVYGMGRFPVTLYYEQWLRLLGASDELKAFLEENKHRLKLKEEA